MGETMEVRMGSLVIDVTDPVQIELLREYAFEPDADELTENDFPGETEAEARQAMLDAVTDVFFPPGSIYGRTPQEEAFRELVRLSDAVDRLEDHADVLFAKASGTMRSSKNFGSRNGILRFSSRDWPIAQQSVAGRDGLSSLPDVGYDLYGVVERLMMKYPLRREKVGSSCGGDVVGFSFDRNRLPAELSRPLQEITEQYSAIAARLKDFDWLECSGAGCPPEDTINMPRNFILRIDASYEDRYEKTGPCSCFSGDTYLQTQGGGVVTFDDLAAISREGGELPELASFDASTQGIVFQQPTMLIDHAQVHSSLMYLQVENSAGEAMTLEVTPEHRLLTQRDGEQEWVRAGELQDGEVLIGGAGEEFLVDLASTRIEEGVHTVYNLSFSSADTGMVPTYLVSADGAHWLAAHNIK